ncbi:DNA-binding response regulator [Paenibacillus nanensis]|uniref:DNA-binding response regulator n=1 Tax=Paenibacillus nanensis TaxID=393251 RepID=A0A3A1VH94_9BACL|nr:response regulator transcription factor [Paenibacillus nanensis]RIX60298.1 DNA-binding response regulator [Paenibacillus nanensis]
MINKIKVMLVEDDGFWRERLFADLNKETDIEVVKAAATKREALEAAGVLDIDVVLMDINLTENQLDGLETTRELMIATQSKIKVIMLTSLTEKEVIVKAFQSGAVNYINKSSFPDIVHSIRDAYADQASIHSDAALAMREEILFMQLSPSEREVHELKERGYSRNEIARLLNKSVSTIKTQIRSVRHKLFK